MLCPKCQFDNADGMNFCGKCGTKLEIFCPHCNFGNPGGYDFCGKCGYKLSLPSETVSKELSFDEKLTKLDRDLAELYEVERKRLKEQVKRNLDRFPVDFMFELTKEDISRLRHEGNSQASYNMTQQRGKK